jgi:uncharacterized protein (DUF1330 family)
MKAYVIANVRVNDPDGMKVYSQMATPAVEKFGGRYLIRGGALSVLEGSPDFSRAVVIEFPNMEAVHAWWSSMDYADAKKLRQKVAQTDMIVVAGIS